MAEDEKQKVEENQPKKEESRSEAKTPANVGEAAPKKEEAPAEKPKGAAAAPAGRVKPSNCTQCNKPLKRGNWYYRNGKFYCNKRCWKKTTEKVA